MCLLLGSERLQADDSMRWGLQGGLLVPASADLRLTSRSGLNATLGARVEWRASEGWGSREHETLRLRLDLERFREAQQVTDSPGLHQVITTKVHNESLGVEQLFYVDRWSMGLGAYGIRWHVDSTNRLETTTGTFAPSSSSSWTRLGLGLMTGYRWAEHAEVELRFVSSHYGQENQPASVVSLNLVWTF
jgi:hypothetical protein